MAQDMSDYFGSEAQQAVLHRGRAMYEITRNDPNRTYYGRNVGVPTPEDAPPGVLAALTQLQGNSHYWRVANDRFEDLRAEVKAMGLSATRYARWVGESDAIETARRVVADNPLPADLHFVWITKDTPRPLVESFGAAALSCGVLPPSLAVLTGRLKPGLALAAADAEGRVVSTAAAAAVLHPEHPEGAEECWWGMLATRVERRGQRLSLILGARVLLEMHKRFGFSRFFTGVEPGNAPSEAVCAKTGLTCSTHSNLVVADPSLLPGGRLTK